MPTISFVKNISPISVSPGANLMQSLIAAGLPVASSCQGDGVCGKCKVQLVSGSGSPPKERERFLLERDQVKKGWRISCQTQVMEDIVVDASYW